MESSEGLEDVVYSKGGIENRVDEDLTSGKDTSEEEIIKGVIDKEVNNEVPNVEEVIGSIGEKVNRKGVTYNIREGMTSYMGEGVQIEFNTNEPYLEE